MGAVETNNNLPDAYFVAYIFKTDDILAEAIKSNLTMEINFYHKEAMRNLGYPEQYIKDCCFVSKEDCDKNFNGNWYYYFH